MSFDRNVPNQALSSPLGGSPFDRALALRDRALALMVKRTSGRLEQRCEAKIVFDQYAGVFPDAGDFTEGGGAQTENDCPLFPGMLFGDCFRFCEGSVSEGSPGPFCGWTFDLSQAGPYTGGEILFQPGRMLIHTTLDSEFPGCVKALPAPLIGPILNMTGQYKFSEYLTVPNLFTTYLFSLTNFDLSEALAVVLFGDGNAVIQFGPPHAIHTYLGLWTPEPGVEHSLHFTITPDGVPAIYLDGVVMPLTFFGDIDSILPELPVNIISFYGGSGVNGEAISVVRDVAFTRGVLPPATVFVCPEDE